MKIVTSPVQGENVLIPRYLGDFSRLLRRIKRTSPGDLSDQFMLAKISPFISRSSPTTSKNEGKEEIIQNVRKMVVRNVAKNK